MGEWFCMSSKVTREHMVSSWVSFSQDTPDVRNSKLSHLQGLLEKVTWKQTRPTGDRTYSIARYVSKQAFRWLQPSIFIPSSWDPIHLGGVIHHLWGTFSKVMTLSKTINSTKYNGVKQLCFIAMVTGLQN